jgi:hypothetical protein
MSKWPLRSELPPLPKLLTKQSALVGPTVVGWLFVIGLVASFVGVSYVIGTEPPGMLQHMMAASVSGHAR